MRIIRPVPLALVAALSVGVAGPLPAHAQTLLNVSYDPTRELYKEFNTEFAKHWKQTSGETVSVRMSHGGSGSQARAVIDGLKAHVVTLALEADVDAIAKVGKLPADWKAKLAHNSAPYTSTIVFLVRKGNPKGIQDWDDLVKPDVKVITPNPKTSGGARWNYLAAWGHAHAKSGGDEAKTRDFIASLFKNVPVLDSGARGSTTTFVQRGIGDVLLAWENEAFLALEEMASEKLEIVVPKMSIKAEPSVALVEGNLDDKTRKVANAYVEYLYSDAGQKIAAKHYYRPTKRAAADPKDLKRFPELKLMSIDDPVFGGWAKVQSAHFADGAIFDQIYKPKP
jgi:sulfate/thiosulfate transport system substrate-binding protein